MIAMDMMMTIDNRDDNTGKTSLLLELFYNFFRVNLINEKKILPIFTNFNFFRTFRLPGIRLHHIDWKQKSSILRFIWNLIIIMILVYSFFYDYPPIQSVERSFYNSKMIIYIRKMSFQIKIRSNYRNDDFPVILYIGLWAFKVLKYQLLIDKESEKLDDSFDKKNKQFLEG
ncbi:hypothetical protein DERF_009171 [Dermatophagoides farinae]|uniref:Uncharacterized protein n=1 Tax=Dermatophagoides farinae TaxID=6954 RepID=A0A922HYK8_DERFA|nr:hypothetical protein DERF_009171 [Dermatophagoides farinae]